MVVPFPWVHLLGGSAACILHSWSFSEEEGCSSVNSRLPLLRAALFISVGSCVVAHVANEFAQEGNTNKTHVRSVCIGGGQGTVTALERAQMP